MPTVTVAVITLLGGIFGENPVAASFYEALEALEAQHQTALSNKTQPPLVIINVRSGGGSVSFARAMAARMKALRPICTVAEAQSAARQIILPACDKILVTKASILGFHSAAMCFKTGLYDGQDFLNSLRVSLAVSLEMAQEMEAGLGKALPESCNILRKAYPEMGNLPCTALHMFAETDTSGPGFQYMFPDSKKIVVVDRLSVPEYPKSDKPGGVSICERP